MSRVQSAIDQMNFARAYTLGLLETIDPGDWFRMPGGVTHVAWQVAHLAMADYRLCLERIRGARPGDEALISAEFLKKFGRDSVPDPDPANNPSPREIRAVLDRVRERVLAELPAVADAALDEPPVTPHRLFDTKHGALVWCGRHELIHAGQIALLRRLLGRKP
ncbi:MAG TPA: DinB family protein, partial [Gemmataceae bacterium]